MTYGFEPQPSKIVTYDLRTREWSNDSGETHALELDFRAVAAVVILVTPFSPRLAF